MRLSAVFLLSAGVLAGLMPGAAPAEPVSGNEARKLLFSPRGVDLVANPQSGLDAVQDATVQAILQQLKSEAVANYYGSIAVSPAFFEMMAADPGGAALSGLLQITEKFHSPEAADRVALDACRQALAEGQAECVIAARVLPRKWQPRALQMSVEATNAFKVYRKGRGAKAFAISPGTGAYAFAKGAAAETVALTDCNLAATAKGGADCEIVIAD